MATLNEASSGKAVKGRTKKTAPRVDLTAMVDLMFLLTTFFMLTTSLSNLNAADVAKPDHCEACSMDYPASRTMTVLLGKDHQAVEYMGTAQDAKMNMTAVKDIQKAINANQAKVARANHNNASKYMLVIIKPTATSRFQDYVDLIDEMKIAGIKSYTIDDENILPEEISFLKTNKL
ncbi:biopolymer transporter ExbD [Pedobacter petrophilus]|uniref:Biopolymer transporter ExbD n=1 Tax=Pedobacter petrophilus TaxID=1908241 RepID=A0A7K0FVT0_9SPHI|nr:biopolymer transporter ExbD [Pedobacter petrophilus]MRX75462.1 biopolymer transporter ExbD [Pedobacter petrophilus]